MGLDVKHCDNPACHSKDKEITTERDTCLFCGTTLKSKYEGVFDALFKRGYGF